MTQKEFVNEYEKTSLELEEDVRQALKDKKVYDNQLKLTAYFVLLMKSYNKLFNQLENTYKTTAFTSNYRQSVSSVNKFYNYEFNKVMTAKDIKTVKQIKSDWINKVSKARKRTIKTIESDLKLAGRQSRTVSKATEKAVKLFNKNGIRTFKLKTKSGKVIKYNIDYYAKLVTESSSNKARDFATINTVKRNKRELVQFSSHSTICVICGTYAEVRGVGRVYSLTRNNTQYPYIWDIPSYRGNGRLHPNCKHYLLPVMDDTVTAKTKDISNLPFTDQRSKTAIDKYDKEQKRKRKINYNKKKAERVKNNKI